jgi:ribosomal protein S18 acetylase RimI-like enzyme
LALVGWTEEEKADFLRMQFEAQHTYYQQMFPDASFQLILREDTPIGRLYIDRRSDEIRIVDIALLPEHRDRGIGSAIMRDILAEGKAQGLPVRIHVERNNPALRLYRRMGFKKIGETGVYLLMERRPADASPKGSERC